MNTDTQVSILLLGGLDPEHTGEQGSFFICGNYLLFYESVCGNYDFPHNYIFPKGMQLLIKKGTILIHERDEILADTVASFLNCTNKRSGQMLQRRRAHSAFAEDSWSVPSSHVREVLR